MRNTKICWCLRARQLQTKVVAYTRTANVRLFYSVSKLKDNNIYFANQQFISVIEARI